MSQMITWMDGAAGILACKHGLQFDYVKDWIIKDHITSDMIRSLRDMTSKQFLGYMYNGKGKKMAKRFKIKKSTAIKLFKSLGFKTAGNWPTDRLQSKLKKLPEIADGENVGEWAQEKLDRIERADEVIIKEKDEEIMAKKKKDKKKKSNGKKKEVVEEKVVTKKKDKKKSAPKKDEKKKVAKKKTNKKVDKKDKKTIKKTDKKKTATKSTVEKDQFGTKLGTQGATINACLSKKGITLEAISKKTKMTTKRINDHLWGMCKKGVVKKNDKKQYTIA